MKKLQYRIFIEKERMGKAKNAFVYNAHCPALGLADWGNSIDEAIKNITDLIVFHIETLASLGYDVPVEEDSTTVVASVEVPGLSKAKFVPA